MAPTEIPWTGNPEADILLAEDGNALLIGFVLDQQVTVQKAFAGPFELRGRLGHLDPARISSMEPTAFAAVCQERPAIHRYPAAMATRIHDLCDVVVTEYGGDGARVWTDARDGADLIARLEALPGFGPLKVGSLATLLYRRYDLDLAGLDELLPAHPTLGGVDTAEQLTEYQSWKRSMKAAKRAASA